MHKIIPRSLLWQLILVSLCVQVFIFGLILWHDRHLYEHLQLESDREETRIIAPLLNAALSPLIFQHDYAAIRTLLDHLNSPELRFLDVYDTGGQPIAHYRSQEPKPDITSAMPDRVIETSHTLQWRGQNVGEVRFGLSARLLPDSYKALWNEHIKIMLLGLVLAAGIMSLMSYRLIARIKSLLRQTRMISSGESIIKADADGYDELSQLEMALKQMHTSLSERNRMVQLNEQRFRDFARAGIDWFWELDARLQITWLSENFEKMTGYPRKKAYEKPVGQNDARQNLSNPDYQNYLNALRNHQPFKDVEVFRETLRGPRWRRLNGVPVFDEHGVFQGYRGSTTDITELRKLRQNLADQQHQFLEAVDMFDSAFVLIGADHRLLQWNRKYRERIEVQGLGELLTPGVTFETLLDGQLERRMIADAIGCEAQWRQWRLDQFRHDTHTFDLQVALNQWFSVRHQRLPDGSVLMLQFDISERKRAEKLLIEAKQEAERANAKKSQFLAIASHDLRQPLQGMRILKDVMAMELADNTELSKVFIEWEHALSAMEHLLQGYLDISRLESGAVTPHPEDFSVQELLQPIYEAFVPQAKSKQLQLHLVACSAVIRSDRLLLGQILRNLVANALRYTRQGKIVVGCRRRGAHLSLQVWDTGPGISKDQQSRIFEEFYQIDNPARTHSEGYGIGLTIVKLAAGLLGHKIHIVSQPGKGTLFAIDVPLGTLSTSVSAPVKPPALNTDAAASMKTVMVVEDDPTIRRSLVLLLKQKGFQTIVCDNGEQALQYLTENSPPPHQVITDLWLPGSYTGFQWLETLKQMLPVQSAVIVISGDTSAEVHQAVEKIGFTLQIKPIKAQKLLAMLNQ